MKRIITLPVLFFLLNLNLLAAGNPDEPSTNIVRSGFLKNAGQVYDMQGNLCPDVLYSMQLNGVTIFVTKNGLTYAMQKQKRGQKI